MTDRAADGALLAAFVALPAASCTAPAAYGGGRLGCAGALAAFTADPAE